MPTWEIVCWVAGVLGVGVAVWYFWGSVLASIATITSFFSQLFTAFTTTPAQKIEQKEVDTETENTNLKAGGVPEQDNW